MSREAALEYLLTPGGNKIEGAELRSAVNVIYDDIPQGGASISLADYAVGDGLTDDTEGIKTAVAALKSGMTLTVPTGMTFKHTDNIVVSGLSNITMSGGGTIAHGSDADSSGGWAFEGCYDVTVENVTFTSTATTRRSGDYSHRLFLYQCGAVHVRNVTINGSAAAGILLDTTDGFVIEHCTISHTLADSLHMTHESKNGVINHVVSDYSGDDGIAVVSYDSRPTPVSNVQISNVTITNQLWGRGISVVGGYNIHYRDCSVTKSSAAGIYVAAESGFDTQGVNNCSFTNIQLIECVQQASDTPELRPRPDEAALKHGAITVWRGRLAPYTLTDVLFTQITITNTQVDAYSDVQLVCYDAVNKQPERLDFSNFVITQIDPHNALDDTVVDASKYNTKNWIVNGELQEDHVAWASTDAVPIMSTGGTMAGTLNLSSNAPVTTLDATPKSYVDASVRGNGVLFGALYTAIAPTSEPSSTINGQVSIEDQGSDVWKIYLQRVLSDGSDVLANFTNIDALFPDFEIVLVHENGKFVRLSPNDNGYLSDPYNVSAWFCSVVSGDPEAFPTSGKCNVFFQEVLAPPSTISVTTAQVSSHLTVSSGANVASVYPTYLRVTDGSDTSNIYPTYISSGVAYLENIEATGASVISYDIVGRQAVKSGALSIVRKSSNSSSTIIAAYPTSADEAAGTNAYFELRGSGALKIGAAVNPDDAAQKSYVDSKASPLGEVSVKAYGATGDGTTDDRAAIQAAINAAGVGGVVVFPAGDYRISSSIQPLSKQILVGAHSPRYETVSTATCQLRATSGFSDTRLILANPGVAGVTIRNLALVGRGATTGTIAGIDFNTRASSTGERHWMLQQVSISACSTAAIYGHLHVGDFRDCHFYMNAYGVLTSGSDTWFDARMIGCQVYFNRNGGIMFDSTGTAGQVVITDTRIERSGVDPTAITTPFNTNAPGIKLGAAGNIQIIGCSTDSNTGAGLHIEQSASHYVYNVSVIGCHFARDGAGDEATSQFSGIYLKGCSHIKITACTVGAGYSVDGAGSGFLHPYYAMWMENATQTDVAHCRMEGAAATYDLWVHVVAGTVFQSRLYLPALGYDGPIPDPAAGTPTTDLGKWGTLDGLTTEAKSIRYQQSTVPRWNVTSGDEASGAHLTVDRYNNAGTYQDTPFKVLRSTGEVITNQQTVKTNVASAIPLEAVGASGQSTSFFRVSDYTFTPFINARSDKVFEVNYGSSTYGMIRQGSTLICRDGAGAGNTLIGAGNSIASPGTFVFEVRGDGATKIGPAVNTDDAIQMAQLQAIVAASTDFADFKTRMAAW